MFMNGYSYISEYDTDVDVRKILHYVKTPSGQMKHIPWSPYEHMDESDFKLWIYLGMPTPKKSNFDKKSLVEFVNGGGA